MPLPFALGSALGIGRAWGQSVPGPGERRVYVVQQWRVAGWRVDSGFNSCSGSGGIFSMTPMRRLLQMSLK